VTSIVILRVLLLELCVLCFPVTGSSVDGADLKLAFAALTTVLLEAAKLDKDELSLRCFFLLPICYDGNIMCAVC